MAAVATRRQVDHQQVGETQLEVVEPVAGPSAMARTMLRKLYVQQHDGRHFAGTARAPLAMAMPMSAGLEGGYVVHAVAGDCDDFTLDCRLRTR